MPHSRVHLPVSRPQAAHAAHVQGDRDAGLAGAVQLLDHEFVLQLVHLGPDSAGPSRFGVFGPPTIIFFGPDGQQRHGYEVVGYMKAADFAAHVQRAFGAAPVVAANAESP